MKVILKLQGPVQYNTFTSNVPKCVFCFTYIFYQRVQLNLQKSLFLSLCIILWWHCWTTCRQRAIRLLLNTDTFAGWVTGSLYHNVTGIFGKSQLWSVFRWDLNAEQAREVFHAAYENLLAMNATHNCMPGCENILAVTASWLISLDFVCVFYQKLKVSCTLVFMDEATLETTTEMFSREAGWIPWPVRSCEFTLLDNGTRLWHKNTFIFHRLAFCWWKDTLKLNMFWDLLSSVIVRSIKW